MVAPSVVVFSVVYVSSFVFVFGFGDVFLVWVGLEINMMSFIGLCFIRNDIKCMESLYKYFFVQSLASGLFLVMFYVGGVMTLVLMIKIAAGPFFFWLPGVMSGFSWFCNSLLMTVQKVLPLMLMSGNGGSEVLSVGLVSLSVGLLGSFNQSEMKSLMAYSSVSHAGWMMVVQITEDWVWMLYMIIYGVVLVSLILYLWSNIVDMVSGGSYTDSGIMLMLMLNMAGMPPFLGFVMKWLVLSVVMVVSFLLVLLMIIVSLGMFYIYIRVSYDIVVGGGIKGVSSVSESLVGPMMWFIMVGIIIMPLVLQVV